VSNSLEKYNQQNLMIARAQLKIELKEKYKEITSTTPVKGFVEKHYVIALWNLARLRLLVARYNAKSRLFSAPFFVSEPSALMEKLKDGMKVFQDDELIGYAVPDSLLKSFVDLAVEPERDSQEKKINSPLRAAAAPESEQAKNVQPRIDALIDLVRGQLAKSHEMTQTSP
jgi:hypothetical protein